MKKELEKKSKKLSLVLRHKPEVANISLDKNGWAKVSEILNALQIEIPELEEIVETNDKKRFEFDNNKIKIRARQGHSIEVDVELHSFVPTIPLYHGTSVSNKKNIKLSGIKKQSRQHVHLSDNIDTAINVGSRHGIPLIFEVDAIRMHQDGFKFFKSNNDVYLTEFVPPVYIKIVNHNI